MLWLKANLALYSLLYGLHIRVLFPRNKQVFQDTLVFYHCLHLGGCREASPDFQLYLIYPDRHRHAPTGWLCARSTECNPQLGAKKNGLPENSWATLGKHFCSRCLPFPHRKRVHSLPAAQGSGKPHNEVQQSATFAFQARELKQRKMKIQSSQAE